MQKSKGLLVFVLLLTHFSFSQKIDSTINTSHFSGSRFTPQFYYLRQDNKDGFYFTCTLTLAKKNFPLTVQSIINKTIQTDVPGSQDFVWNASLIYSFSKKYVQH